MGEEEHHNLFDGLADIRYARDFLRLVGPSGSAERARFDEVAWGYGDPTYMGGDLMEVFDSQLKSVVHTLFGVLGTHELEPGEDALQVDLLHAAVAMGEDEILTEIGTADGGPLEAETIAPVSPGSMAAHLSPSRTGNRRDYPGEGTASIGCGGISSLGISSLGYRVQGEPAEEFEDVMAVEISGEPEEVERLSRNLLAGCGEGEAVRLYHWKPGTARHRMLGEAEPVRDAMILLVGFEYFDLRSMFHDVVFARLLAAWNEMRREIKHREP
jgi:hypothetical protein